jgi:succinate dehydrogenase / fumarate reductase, flavoprotein subunit
VDHPAFKEAETNVRATIQKLLSINGTKTVDEFHKELGLLMWDYCGMARNAEGLQFAKEKIRALREEFWQNVKLYGVNEDMNQTIEKAGRVADFLELGELMVTDALHRNESCGGHFREEYQTPENEALRDDANFAYVAAWEYTGPDSEARLNKEPLVFENVKLTQRSYK